MTVGVVNNWNDLAVTGRVDVDALTIAGVAYPNNDAVTPASVTTTTVTASGTVTAGTLVTAANTPATADAVGVAGTIAWDATHIYVCVATNTWVRAELATWA